MNLCYFHFLRLEIIIFIHSARDAVDAANILKNGKKCTCKVNSFGFFNLVKRISFILGDEIWHARCNEIKAPEKILVLKINFLYD